VIRTFLSKPLAELWSTGRTALIDVRLHRRILLRLDRLDAAVVPEEMNLPGFDFHALRGFKPTRYSVHVNGPWCVTFAFDQGDAVAVDFEQYH
jgi:toxin HigB-1